MTVTLCDLCPSSNNISRYKILTYNGGWDWGADLNSYRYLDLCLYCANNLMNYGLGMLNEERLKDFDLYVTEKKAYYEKKRKEIK